jgi:hypothetical protein
MKLKKSRPIPFEFVLEHLFSGDPVVKPMFGCHAIYVKNKIVLILRKKEDFENDNGVWIATTHEHHKSLQEHFPSMRPISLFGTGESGWQNLPEDSPDFEESVIWVCELILKRDARIGKTPKPRSKKKRKE